MYRAHRMSATPSTKRPRANPKADQSPEMPPFDKNAEMAVLASILRDNSVADEVQSFLDPDAFHIEAHQIIYRITLALRREGRPMDLVTVASEAIRLGQFENIGGAEYLGKK